MRKIEISPYYRGLINIGRQGENDAVLVVFDLAEFRSTYGEGVAELLHQRSGDAVAHPVATEQDGDVLRWVVSKAETAMQGSGRVELRWHVGDTLAKSRVYVSHVDRALYNGGEPPEEAKSWFDSLVELKNSVVEWLADARAFLADLMGKLERGELNGKDGKDGTDGRDGVDGIAGVDGFSPDVGVKTEADGAVITITDKSGTTTAKVFNGKDGRDGPVGPIGPQGPEYDDSQIRAEVSEIKEDLAQKAERSEIPEKLPNPNAITFTGSANGTYDGSAPLTIHIPNLGSGGGVDEEARKEIGELRTDLGICTDSAIYGSYNKLNLNSLKEQTKNGITFSPVFDRYGRLECVRVNGTATSNAIYDLQTVRYAAGDILTGCPSGGAWNTYNLMATYQTASGGWVSEKYDTGNGHTIEEMANAAQIRIAVFVRSGVTVKDVVYYPMLRDASAPSEYQKQSLSVKEVKDMVDTLTFPTNLYVDVCSLLSNPNANDLTAELNEIMKDENKIYYFRGKSTPYKVRGTVLIRSGCRIVGESPHTSSIYTYGTGRFQMTDGAKDILIERMYFIGNWDYSHVDDSKEDSVGIYAKRVEWLSIKNCRFLQFHTALKFDNDANNSLDTFSAFVTIEDTDILNCIVGIDLKSDISTGRLNEFRVQNCNINSRNNILSDKVDHNKIVGIRASGFDTLVCTGNSFELLTRAIEVRNEFHHCVFRDNHFEQIAQKSPNGEQRCIVFCVDERNYEGTEYNSVTGYGAIISGNYFCETHHDWALSSGYQLTPVYNEYVTTLSLSDNAYESTTCGPNILAISPKNGVPHSMSYFRNVRRLLNKDWKIDYDFDTEQNFHIEPYGVPVALEALPQKYLFNKTWHLLDAGSTSVAIPPDIKGKYVMVHFIPVDFENKNLSFTTSATINGYGNYAQNSSDVQYPEYSYNSWLSIVAPFSEVVTLSASDAVYISDVYVIQDDDYYQAY